MTGNRHNYLSDRKRRHLLGLVESRRILDGNERIPSGETRLHEAAKLGEAKAVEAYVRAGANIESKAPWGATPFFVACQFDRSKVAKILAKHGANVLAPLPDGVTTRDIARKNNCTKTLRLLDGLLSNPSYDHESSSVSTNRVTALAESDRLGTLETFKILCETCVPIEHPTSEADEEWNTRLKNTEQMISIFRTVFSFMSPEHDTVFTYRLNNNQPAGLMMISPVHDRTIPGSATDPMNAIEILYLVTHPLISGAAGPLIEAAVNLSYRRNGRGTVILDALPEAMEIYRSFGFVPTGDDELMKLDPIEAYAAGTLPSDIPEGGQPKLWEKVNGEWRLTRYRNQRSLGGCGNF